GRNGKGTMFETLKAIMGDLAWAVQPELILEQKNTRSSAGPSPDLVSLQGRRLVIASETDEGRRISGSKVKSLTGADTINARAPHDRFETNFTPTHKLFLYTNHIPKGLTRDYALYKRLLFINYPLKFVDNPSTEHERQRDPALPAKLMAEGPGILAWLVQGCLEWQEHGLAPPDKLRADVDALRASEDTFQQFFTDRMADDKDSICLFKDIYTKFQAWYIEEIDENTRYIPSKIKISGWLEKRGYDKAKPSGQATFFGVGLRP
ncbi:MAG: phage/plasmid primase, P4 family, partial [Deltaproteobacteria bacterium]|nr:phage/plasmid primase, P4 family [Deltaproteobacteria bacterium]